MIWYWNNYENNEIFLRSLSLKDMPCLNCRLIEMGEMACYTERCSQVWKSNGVDSEHDNYADDFDGDGITVKRWWRTGLQNCHFQIFSVRSDTPWTEGFSAGDHQSIMLWVLISKDPNPQQACTARG